MRWHLGAEVSNYNVATLNAMKKASIVVYITNAELLELVRDPQRGLSSRLGEPVCILRVSDAEVVDQAIDALTRTEVAT